MDNNELLNNLINSLLEDRRIERRNKLIFRVFSGILIIFFLYILLFPSDRFSTTYEHTGLVEINGVISSSSNASVEKIIPSIKDALDNESCIGVIIKINSPGGSATQSKIIHDEILKLRLNTKKPIYTVIEDMGTSGGYYIAASSEKIISNQSSIVGSIGVRIDSLNVKSLFDKLGIKSQSIASGEDKLILDPFRELSDEHRLHLEKLTSEIHNQFVSDIKKSRGNKIKTDKIFSGLFWTGIEAKKLGLVDELGSLYDVNKKYLQDSKIINYTRKENVLETIIQKTVSQILQNNYLNINY
tara:strand:+ start:12287 stop:13186 length:900 start_codon:yes stop_codon:yes gene_type:complete